MVKLLLWLKYLRRRRVVLLSVSAVALSVALLTVVASLFKGFIRSYEQSAVNLLGDIVLESGSPFPEYRTLIERLERTDEVEAAAATTQTPGLLHIGKGSGNVRAVVVRGIEPEDLARVTTLRQSLLLHKDLDTAPSFEGTDPNAAMGGFVGIGVLAEPDPVTDRYDLEAVAARIGQTVVLTSGSIPAGEPNQTAGPRPRRRTFEFVIRDVVYAHHYLFDQEAVYLPLADLHSRLDPDPSAPRAERLQIKLRPGVDPERAEAAILATWQAFAQGTLQWGPNQIARAKVATAKEMQARFLAEVQKQLHVLMLIFGVVDCGAVLLVLCIFYMIVRLKQKDIAILKACGCPSAQIAWLFLGFGAVVGAAGCGLGVLLGCAFTHHINALEDWLSLKLGLKLWDSSAYQFDWIPNQVAWGSVLEIVLLATAAACVGALVPAIVAARTRPVEILRYE
ncbi:MAG: ABC transporter permease [Phycisphaerae bacterium]|nr:ABC transporter permease [Phycisphaerae bacterium]